MCIAAAVSSVGEVGAAWGELTNTNAMSYSLWITLQQQKYQKSMKSNKVESHLIVL